MHVHQTVKYIESHCTACIKLYKTLKVRSRPKTLLLQYTIAVKHPENTCTYSYMGSLLCPFVTDFGNKRHR